VVETPSAIVLKRGASTKGATPRKDQEKEAGPSEVNKKPTPKKQRASLFTVPLEVFQGHKSGGIFPG